MSFVCLQNRLTSCAQHIAVTVSSFEKFLEVGSFGELAAACGQLHSSVKDFWYRYRVGIKHNETVGIKVFGRPTFGRINYK